MAVINYLYRCRKLTYRCPEICDLKYYTIIRKFSKN